MGASVDGCVQISMQTCVTSAETCDRSFVRAWVEACMYIFEETCVRTGGGDKRGDACEDVCGDVCTHRCEDMCEDVCGGDVCGGMHNRVLVDTSVGTEYQKKNVEVCAVMRSGMRTSRCMRGLAMPMCECYCRQQNRP